VSDAAYWQGRFDALARLDEEDAAAYDAAHERLEADWRAAYEVAFVETAVARGWKPEDAQTWPSEIGADAFLESWQDASRDPREAARRDVIECEGQAE
jgi:hypothetical protein